MADLFSTDTLSAIVEDLLPHYAPATINRSLGALRKSLRNAWERGRTPVDYSSLVKALPEKNQRTVYLTMEQVDTIAQHASESVRAAIWLALLTGCRRGEVCKMQPEHIGKKTIRLPAGNTKTERYREVPIVPALRPWLKHIPLPISFEGVKSGFRRAREAAGMPHVHFHDLRHSAVAIWLDAGVPIEVPAYQVQRVCGTGIEVILDVVYNHTGEGNELGPLLGRQAVALALVDLCLAHPVVEMG